MDSWIHNVSPYVHDLKHCLMHGFAVYLRRMYLHTEHRYACFRDIHLRWSGHCYLLISFSHLIRPQLSSVSTINHTLWPNTLWGICYPIIFHTKSWNTIYWLKPIKKYFSLRVWPLWLLVVGITLEIRDHKFDPYFILSSCWDH